MCVKLECFQELLGFVFVGLMQFSCTDPRGNQRCDLRTMASNLCFENGWRRTTKFQVLSITNDRWNPLLKKKYTMPVAWDYRLYRGERANQEIFKGEVQTIGSEIKNMLNSCSSNCKMLQESEIQIFLTTGGRFFQSDSVTRLKNKKY